MNGHALSLKDEIDQIERRLELRRERLSRHFEEAKEGLATRAAKAVRWWPIVALAGSLAVGVAAGRHPSRAAPAALARAPRPSHTPRNVFATLLGLAAMALRFGASQEVRAFWSALTAFRSRR